MFRLPKAILIQEKHQKRKMVRGNREKFQELFLMSKIVQNYAKNKLLFIFSHLMRPGYVCGHGSPTSRQEEDLRCLKTFIRNCTF